MLGEWLGNNWIQLAETSSIVAGLFFGALTIHQNTKTRRLANLLTITSSHRNLWLHLASNRRLNQVFSPSRKISVSPITPEEEQFVVLLILHLKSTYETMKDGMRIYERGLREDIAEFLELPVPQAVWMNMRRTFEREFIGFVEACCSGSTVTIRR